MLVTSGGFGVGPMAEIIRSFAGIPAARLTVVCGDNPARVAEARRVAAEARVPAEVVGFEPDMARRIAAAHVIVGKPGGLTVSESLAAGRPMVLVGACPGQETMNQAWLVEQGAAVACQAAAAGRTVAALQTPGVRARPRAGRRGARPSRHPARRIAGARRRAACRTAGAPWRAETRLPALCAGVSAVTLCRRRRLSGARAAASRAAAGAHSHRAHRHRVVEEANARPVRVLCCTAVKAGVGQQVFHRRR